MLFICQQCTVHGIHPGGVTVQVAHNIRGLIPRLHLAEMLLKHPEKKFLPGKKLKCKVLIL
jgi:rRNA biogenesis protein RRP5